MVLDKLINKVKGKKGRIKKKWEFQADSSLLTTPVVSNWGGRNFIIFGTKDGKVYSVDDESKVKWLYDIQGKKSEIELLFLDEETLRSIRCPPTVADITGNGEDEVIVGSDIGTLSVISSEGNLLWDIHLEAPIRSSPLVYDIDGDEIPEVIFGCTDGYLYVLDAKGKIKWKYKAKSAIESKAAVYNGDYLKIVFGSKDGTIYSLKADGTLEWTFETGNEIKAQPVAADLDQDGETEIIIGSLDNNLYALNNKGHVKWKFETQGSIFSKVSIADINKDGKLEVVFGSCDNKVYALDCNGEEIWSYETDFWVVATPMVLDIDRDGDLEIVVGSYDHSVYILDAKGAFILNYMPGISGIAQQPGHYTDMMTSEPGKYTGKKIWQFKTSSYVVGHTLLESGGKPHLVVGTKKGKVKLLSHEE